jgi:hypothetical protein
MVGTKQSLFKDVLCPLGRWHVAINQALMRLRQEDYEFRVSLGYLARPCLKKICLCPDTQNIWLYQLISQRFGMKVTHAINSANSWPYRREIV